MIFETSDIEQAAWLWKSQQLPKPKVKRLSHEKCVFLFEVKNSEDIETLAQEIYPQTDHFDVSEGRKTLVRIIKGYDR